MKVFKQLYYSMKSVRYIKLADKWLERDKGVSLAYKNLAVEFRRKSDSLE